MMLLGRQEPCARIDEMIGAARSGRSGVMAVRGEPGVGKSALLTYAIRQASGFRVISISGVESEMELPFASLHQVCTPLLQYLERLPGPQCSALETAFGLSVGPPPDRLLVGAGRTQPFVRSGPRSAPAVHSGRRPLARPGVRLGPGTGRPPVGLGAKRPVVLGCAVAAVALRCGLVRRRTSA